MFQAAQQSGLRRDFFGNTVAGLYPSTFADPRFRVEDSIFTLILLNSSLSLAAVFGTVSTRPKIFQKTRDTPSFAAVFCLPKLPCLQQSVA